MGFVFSPSPSCLQMETEMEGMKEDAVHCLGGLWGMEGRYVKPCKKNEKLLLLQAKIESP